MKEVRIKWNKVSPADLSTVCCANYFAFSKKNKIRRVFEVTNKCLFTEVILSSVGHNHSLYEFDIWVGRIVGEEQLLGKNNWINYSTVLELLRRSVDLKGSKELQVELASNKAKWFVANQSSVENLFPKKIDASELLKLIQIESHTPSIMN